MPKVETQDLGDGIRAAYKQFLDSPGGQDLMRYLVSIELACQAQGKRVETAELKAFEMVKIGLLYDIRTYIDNMSKPAPSPRERSSRGSK